MNSIKSIFSIIFLSLIFVSSQSFTVFSDIEGSWTFEVENAPYGYEKGEILIAMDGENYTAEVGFEYGKLKGEKVSVEGNKISFEVYVEGVQVVISMDIDGDTFVGKAKSSEGTFSLKGKRK